MRTIAASAQVHAPESRGRCAINISAGISLECGIACLSALHACLPSEVPEWAQRCIGCPCQLLTFCHGAWQALKPAQWREALKTAADALKSVKGNELRFIAGHLADLESMAALQVGWAPVTFLISLQCLPDADASVFAAGLFMQICF